MEEFDFFSDIRGKLIALAAGLASIATIVPLFLNRMTETFGFSMKTGFCVFVFLYFIFPFCLYSRLLVKTVPELRGRSWLVIIGIPLGLVFLGLVFLTSGCAYLFIIILMVPIALIFCSWFRQWPSAPEATKGFVTEWLTITSVLLLAYIVLFWNNTSRIKDAYRKDATYSMNRAFHMYAARDSFAQFVIAPADSLAGDYREKVLMEMLRYPNENLPSATITSGDSATFASLLAGIDALILPPLDQIRYQETRDMIVSRSAALWPTTTGSHTAGYLSVYKKYEELLMLQQYLRIRADQKEEEVKGLWAKLISSLQWKGLVWLLLLMLTYLSLWLYNRIKEYDEQGRMKDEGRSGLLLQWLKSYSEKEAQPETYPFTAQNRLVMGSLHAFGIGYQNLAGRLKDKGKWDELKTDVSNLFTSMLREAGDIWAKTNMQGSVNPLHEVLTVVSLEWSRVGLIAGNDRSRDVIGTWGENIRLGIEDFEWRSAGGSSSGMAAVAGRYGARVGWKLAAGICAEVSEWASRLSSDEAEVFGKRSGQAKTFFYILVLLVIPFFKPVDKANIDLDRPFMNFSTNSVLERDIIPGKDSTHNEVLPALDRMRQQLIGISSQADSIEYIARKDSARLFILGHNVIKEPDQVQEFDSAK